VAKALPKGMQQAIKAGQTAVKQQAPQQQPSQTDRDQKLAGRVQQFQQPSRDAALNSRVAQFSNTQTPAAPATTPPAASQQTTTADLQNSLTDPIDIASKAIQALQAFSTAEAAPEPEAKEEENDGNGPADTVVQPAPGKASVAESILVHPLYRTLQALYEEETAEAPAPAKDPAELKKTAASFLQKYSDPNVLAKDKKGLEILQKFIQIAKNEYGVDIPNMPTIEQIKVIDTTPTTIESPDDLKKALDANPQAAQAFVQALARAPKNGPIGQAFNSLLQKLAQ